MSSCCILVYIAVLRGTRAEKVDHYCSNYSVGRTSYSSPPHAVPILMASTPAAFSVTGECVKAKS